MKTIKDHENERRFPLFHLALPVPYLEEADLFLVQTLGCARGRQPKRWVDYNFFGHQLTLHLGDKAQPSAALLHT